jgi:hypothetical protein
MNDHKDKKEQNSKSSKRWRKTMTTHFLHALLHF